MAIIKSSGVPLAEVKEVAGSVASLKVCGIKPN